MHSFRCRHTLRNILTAYSANDNCQVSLFWREQKTSVYGFQCILLGTKNKCLWYSVHSFRCHVISEQLKCCRRAVAAATPRLRRCAAAAASTATALLPPPPLRCRCHFHRRCRCHRHCFLLLDCCVSKPEPPHLETLHVFPGALSTEEVDSMTPSRCIEHPVE